MTLDPALFPIVAIACLSIILLKQIDLHQTREMGKWPQDSDTVAAIDAISEELERIHEEIRVCTFTSRQNELEEQRNKLNDTLSEIARRTHESRLTIVPKD
jgi:hypothetical protein